MYHGVFIRVAQIFSLNLGSFLDGRVVWLGNYYGVIMKDPGLGLVVLTAVLTRPLLPTSMRTRIQTKVQRTKQQGSCSFDKRAQSMGCCLNNDFPLSHFR